MSTLIEMMTETLTKPLDYEYAKSLAEALTQRFDEIDNRLDEIDKSIEILKNDMNERFDGLEKLIVGREEKL